MNEKMNGNITKSTPLVSIIMGAYNCETTIEQCVNSVRKQTYRNWELIICNDCSTDGTKDILNNYSISDSRIIVIHNKENQRLASSLNNCLKIAKGKYIARLDADDECLPNRIEAQVNYLEENPEIDVVGTSRIIFDENGDIGICLSKENPKKEDLLFDTPFAHPTIMMKKTVYDDLGGYTVSKETMRAEDLDLWFRFYAKGYNGYNLEEPLYRYHQSEEDYKKRSLKAAIGTSKVFISGYKKVGFSNAKYIFALKPIISALIPNRLMYLWHRNQCSRGK